MKPPDSTGARVDSTDGRQGELGGLREGLQEERERSLELIFSGTKGKHEPWWGSSVAGSGLVRAHTMFA